ncbi:serine/threonine-protein kinase [Bremerella sp. JC770]|uniref:serine/threonine protein kinase n=1 Tax=Bremerella sp. JC770 TaxID=3232137 RepID=UPI003458F582
MMNELQLFCHALSAPSMVARNDFLAEAFKESPKSRQVVENMLRMHDLIDVDPDLSHRSGQIEKPGSSSIGPRLRRLIVPTTLPNCLGTIDRYLAIRVIGRGSTGLVLEAVDPVLNRIVAIKVLCPSNMLQETIEERFRREGKLMAQVDDPNVAKVYSFSECRDYLLLVMEFVAGNSLRTRMKAGGRIALSHVVKIAKEIAAGLETIHRQGLIHRDLKPSNVMLSYPKEQVKLLDFGIARFVNKGDLTNTGEINGTPKYMSPEQAGGREVDQRTDLFSLGTLIYEMLSGVSPFNSDSPLETMRKVCEHEPAPLKQYCSDVPVFLTDLISELLSKNPEDRPGSIAEVARRLDNLDRLISDGALEGELKRLKRRQTLRRLAWLSPVIVLISMAVLRPADAKALFDKTLGFAIGNATIEVELNSPDITVEITNWSSRYNKETSGQVLVSPGQYDINVYRNGELLDTDTIFVSRREYRLIRPDSNGKML